MLAKLNLDSIKLPSNKRTSTATPPQVLVVTCRSEASRAVASAGVPGELRVSLNGVARAHLVVEPGNAHGIPAEAGSIPTLGFDKPRGRFRFNGCQLRIDPKTIQVVKSRSRLSRAPRQAYKRIPTGRWCQKHRETVQSSRDWPQRRPISWAGSYKKIRRMCCDVSLGCSWHPRTCSFSLQKR